MTTENFPENNGEQTPVERVMQAADEIVADLSELKEDERAELVSALGDKFEDAGIKLIDFSASFKTGLDPHPQALEGKKGALSGDTRARVLARAAMRYRSKKHHR